MSDTIRPRLETLIRDFLRGRFLRFAVIGALGAGVDIAALYLAIDGLGLGLYLGRVFSFACAVTFTFLANRTVTFRDVARQPLLRQWVRFVTSQLMGLGANYAVYAGLVTWWAFAREVPAVAVVVGALVGLAFNYTAASRLVFRT